jgi:hypothetical protein
MVVETATQERTSRVFEQALVSNGDAAAFSIDVTRQMIGPMTELAIVAAQERTRLVAELQIAALEAMHEAHAAMMRGFLGALTLVGTSARLVTQASERLQTAAVDAGRRVRETLQESSGMRETTRR